MGGSAMGGGNSKTSTRIPEYMKRWSQQIMKEGWRGREDDYKPWDAADLVGDRNKYHDMAGDQAKRAQGAWQDQYNQANRTFQAGTDPRYGNMGNNAATDAYRNSDVSGPIRASTGATYGPNGEVKFNEFNAENLQRYQNPHEQAVVEQGLDDLDRREELSQDGIADQAAQAGAFGGARHGVANAEMNRNYDDQRSKFVTDVRSQGYGNAVNQYNQERQALFNQTGMNNQSAGQGFNQGMGYANYMQGVDNQNFNQGLQGGQFYAGMGNQNLANMQGAWQLANNQGNGQMAHDQAMKTAGYGQYMTDINWSGDQMAKYMSALAMNPYNKSTTTNPAEQGWLGPALQAGGMAAGMMSDERLKEDITDLKPEKVLGAFSQLPTKSYRYTDDAQKQFGVPEHRDGFMAQDYERVFGNGVKEIDGYKAIDTFDALGKVMAAVKGLEARTRHLKKKAA